MRCRECGAFVLDEADFCEQCGADLPVKSKPKVRSSESNVSWCRECGSDLSEDQDQCPVCGASVFGGIPDEYE